MDKTLAPAQAVLLSPAITPARDVPGTSGLWLILSAPISLALTLLLVVYLAKISF